MQTSEREEERSQQTWGEIWFKHRVLAAETILTSPPSLSIATKQLQIPNLSACVLISKAVRDGGRGRYLLQVVELHGDLPEEEVNVRPPLHGADEVRLCQEGTGSRSTGENLKTEREEALRAARLSAAPSPP